MIQMKKLYYLHSALKCFFILLYNERTNCITCKPDSNPEMQQFDSIIEWEGLANGTAKMGIQKDERSTFKTQMKKHSLSLGLCHFR